MNYVPTVAVCRYYFFVSRQALSLVNLSLVCLSTRSSSTCQLVNLSTRQLISLILVNKIHQLRAKRLGVPRRLIVEAHVAGYLTQCGYGVAIYAVSLHRARRTYGDGIFANRGLPCTLTVSLDKRQTKTARVPIGVILET